MAAAVGGGWGQDRGGVFRWSGHVETSPWGGGEGGEELAWETGAGERERHACSLVMRWLLSD